jgi:hypothetical protein
MVGGVQITAKSNIGKRSIFFFELLQKLVPDITGLEAIAMTRHTCGDRENINKKR